MKNWKRLFFLLVAINMGIVIFVLVLISRPIEDEGKLIKADGLEGYAPFIINTKKKYLNEVINHYLEKEIADSPVKYQVLLAEEVELYGVIPIFSEEIQMKLTFEPQALTNGDLLLKQKSISVGKLQLPVTYLLKFIEERYKLPKGVQINPNDKIVYISMQNLKIKSDFKIKVNEFNLKNNDISFLLFVPIK